ncbi:MFS transporter [Allokutzneria multivorans]|uniref:MFS transporter n=1 Tax=Allokutzneria multivorans TaxID=1142134 RepID=A0ABP7SE44_9PSEU
MPNAALREMLSKVGWSARALVREVNAHLVARGHDALDLTTGCHWLRGTRPRDAATASAVAAVLGHALDRDVRIEHLWPALGGASAPTASAVSGLLGPWTATGAVAVAHSTATGTPNERAALRAARGSDLITSALDGLTPMPGAGISGSGRDRLDPPMLTMLERRLAELRRLDDQLGGGPLSQRLINAELATVLDFLRFARYNGPTGARLLRLSAGLAQLAAWTAFDADNAGAAQRGHLLAIRLARAAKDDIAATNSLGMLAYQSAMTNNPSDAVRLAEAAVAHTRRTCPTTRARAHGRLATAHATAGNLYAYRLASDTARELLAKRDPGDAPPSLYYLTPDQLAAESGHALLQLAITHGYRTHHLLGEATAALTPLATQHHGGEFLRSSVLHGSYLVHAHLGRRDIESAARTAAALAHRIPNIQSRRCRTLLDGVRTALARRRSSVWADEAVDVLDKALSTA